jgi:hypothetical protein
MLMVIHTKSMLTIIHRYAFHKLISVVMVVGTGRSYIDRLHLPVLILFVLPREDDHCLSLLNRTVFLVAVINVQIEMDVADRTNGVPSVTNVLAHSPENFLVE